jgi:hypothetical protein
MMCIVSATVFLVFFSIIPAYGQEKFEKDVISTSGGDLEIIFLGHGTLMLAYGGKVIHIDPYSHVGNGWISLVGYQHQGYGLVPVY